MRILICLLFITATSVFAGTITVADSSSNHAVGGVLGVNAGYVSAINSTNVLGYNAIYIDEHTPTTFMGGQEAVIRNAMINYGVGLVAEYNTAILGQISTILGLATALTTSANSTWSTSMASHPILTGVGIDGGALVNPLTLYNNGYSQVAFSYLPAGAQMIIQTSTGTPILMAGTLGYGRYVLFGYEALESAGALEKQLIHNALFWAAAGNVPEPSTWMLLSIALLGALKLYRRR